MASTPVLGTIFMFAGNFAPRGYAECNGALLPISQNTALFSIIGTYYGGNGTTTFALPDFRGRVPISRGQGPGLNGSYAVGQQTGTETVQLAVGELPAHNHQINTSSTQTSNVPDSAYLASGGAYSGSRVGTGQLSPAAVATTGSNQPHNNLQPLLTVFFIIATVGIFPSRN